MKSGVGGGGSFGVFVLNVFGLKLLGAAERGGAVQIGKKKDATLIGLLPGTDRPSVLPLRR